MPYHLSKYTFKDMYYFYGNYINFFMGLRYLSQVTLTKETVHCCTMVKLDAIRIRETNGKIKKGPLFNNN
jgi:hypothetical protein